MRILVVDDVKSIQNHLSAVLKGLGHSVETATNGLDAFEKAQQNNYQLYIIDHKMPLMDGVQLTKNLKKKAECANTPILFMTTQSIKSLKVLVEFSLFSAVIAKPINEADFISTVNFLIKNISVAKTEQSLLKQIN
ncbi:MAG: response regulator [Colwellia sp.]